jgi:hypothetical protein
MFQPDKGRDEGGGDGGSGGSGGLCRSPAVEIDALRLPRLLKSPDEPDPCDVADSADMALVTSTLLRGEPALER